MKKLFVIVTVLAAFVIAQSLAFAQDSTSAAPKDMKKTEMNSGQKGDNSTHKKSGKWSHKKGKHHKKDAEKKDTEKKDDVPNN